MTPRPAVLGLPFAAGAVTALLLGFYASAHDPTGRDFVLTGFESASSWKSALASITMFLFFVQITLGLRLSRSAGSARPLPAWAPDLHRILGTVAFGFSIPVVFHCVWSLGYQSSDARLATHSLLGCVAYGLYVVKVLTARTPDRPGWALPVVGSTLGLTMLAVWWGSALVFYSGAGS